MYDGSGGRSTSADASISAPAQEGKAAKIVNLCQRPDDCSAARVGAKYEQGASDILYFKLSRTNLESDGVWQGTFTFTRSE